MGHLADFEFESVVHCSKLTGEFQCLLMIQTPLQNSVYTPYIEILNTAKDGKRMDNRHQDMRLSQYQVSNLQLVASHRREQLLLARRGGGEAVETVEPAGALLLAARVGVAV